MLAVPYLMRWDRGLIRHCASGSTQSRRERSTARHARTFRGENPPFPTRGSGYPSLRYLLSVPGGGSIITVEHLRNGGGMQREFDVVIERDSEGYYVASVPALRGCHTQAKSLDELIERIREAVELCLEVEGDAAELSDLPVLSKGGLQ
jgi:predicted RNase H-like HicB family nuclease